MATTREDIASWLKRAQAQKATHLLVVCDTFDYEDYPVEVMPGEDVQKKYQEYHQEGKMSKVMEVYALHLPLDAQLAEHRAFHFEAAGHLSPESDVFDILGS